jgi:hypothetical protein
MSMPVPSPWDALRHFARALSWVGKVRSTKSKKWSSRRTETRGTEGGKKASSRARCAHARWARSGCAASTMSVGCGVLRDPQHLDQASRIFDVRHDHVVDPPQGMRGTTLVPSSDSQPASLTPVALACERSLRSDGNIEGSSASGHSSLVKVLRLELAQDIACARFRQSPMTSTSRCTSGTDRRAHCGDSLNA